MKDNHEEAICATDKIEDWSFGRMEDSCSKLCSRKIIGIFRGGNNTDESSKADNDNEQ